MKKDANKIEMTNLESKIKHMIVHIEGDSDLVLNRMNARNMRMLTADDRKKIRETPNQWEDVITAINWRDPLPMTDTYTESDEAMMHRLLRENAPCISAFGLKKSFGQTVVRNEIDKYATKLEAAMNIKTSNGLVPIEFSAWAIDERLMSPKRGAPITVRLNHFSGWKASFQVDFMDHVYSKDQLVDIINLSGFSMGIGSGRTSGYGRYHVTGVDM